MEDHPATVYLRAIKKRPDESWEEHEIRVAKLRTEREIARRAESEELDRWVQGIEESLRTYQLEIDAAKARLAAEQAEKKQPSPPPFATEEFQLHRRNNGQRAPAHSPRQFAPAVTSSSQQPPATEAPRRARCTIL